jgi:hypothetical protein
LSSLISSPITKRFSPKQQQPREEILQYILERESNGHAADTENFDQIAGLERRSDNRESHQKANQNHRRPHQAGENHAQVWTVLAGGAQYHPADEDAQQIKDEKDEDPDQQSRYPRHDAVGHLVSSLRKFIDV